MGIENLKTTLINPKTNTSLTLKTPIIGASGTYGYVDEYEDFIAASVSSVSSCVGFIQQTGVFRSTTASVFARPSAKSSHFRQFPAPGNAVSAPTTTEYVVSAIGVPSGSAATRLGQANGETGKE